MKNDDTKAEEKEEWETRVKSCKRKINQEEGRKESEDG